MTSSGKRTGLWGGSFNPPTLAHKSLAEYAFSALELDELQWIVTPHNPEKDLATLAPFTHRFAMVTQVLEDREGMDANDIEDRLGSSWTINTVQAMRKERPDDHLFLLIGADNWAGFHRWGGNFAEIFDYVSIVILHRPGQIKADETESFRLFKDRQVKSAADLGKSGNWLALENPLYDVSATQVRDALAKDELPDHITTETLNYIQQHQLYRKT